MTEPRRDSGIALVVVLWVGLLVAAIAGAFILDIRTSARMTRNFVDNAEARALADGGVHLAVHELLLRDEDRQLRRDGRIYRRNVPGGIIEIAVEDEAGKINVNLANDALLEGLFRSAGMAEAGAQGIVEAINAIRTGNETQERLLRSAGIPVDEITSIIEAIRSSGLGSVSSRSINSGLGMAKSTSALPIFAVDALGQLPGMTADIYARVRAALTIYGVNTGIHYPNAPREALLAVPGVAPEETDIFLTKRSVGDGLGALDNFMAEGRARDFWHGEESAFVTVKVLAQTDSGARFVRVAVVEIRRGASQPFVIREWREGDADMLATEQPGPLPATDRQGGSP